MLTRQDLILQFMLALASDATEKFDRNDAASAASQIYQRAAILADEYIANQA